MKIAIYSTDVLCDGLAGIWTLDEFGHPNGPRIGREPGTVLVAFSDNTEKLYKVGARAVVDGEPDYNQHYFHRNLRFLTKEQCDERMKVILEPVWLKDAKKAAAEGKANRPLMQTLRDTYAWAERP